MSAAAKPNRHSPTRRAFLRDGSLLLAFSLLPPVSRAAFNAMGLPQIVNKALPGSLKSTPMLDAWIRISPDGVVTACSGKVELGTGVRTAMVQIVAEQLEIAPAALRFVSGDTGVTPNEGYTAGSHTIADSGTALLHAAAQVAAMVAQGAAAQWKIAPAQVSLARGEAVAQDGRKMHYGAAIRGVDLHRQAVERSPLKPAAAYRVIGQPVPRLDIPAKLTGGASYVQDMRPAGMVHARVVRPPNRGARLKQVDTAAVARMAGVLKVVRDGNYLAVIADDEWRAILAMRALTVAASWEHGPALPQPATIHTHIQQLPMTDIVIRDQGTLPDPVPAARVVRARFTKPFILHGSIGPSCSVALFKDGQLTVWTHTQGVFPLRGALAELTGMPVERVRCIHTEGSGCYGQNGADDVAGDAALLARALPGRHVRVQLMRDQENLWEPYAPAMVTEVEASVGADGRIDSWRYALWSGSHNERPGNAGKLVPGWLLAAPFTPTPSQPMAQPEGGGDRNAIPLYTLPNARVTNHFMPTYPLRTSAMRSLGAHLNVLSIESTMDELARVAGIDPVRFRLNHMDDPRAAAVMRLAAEKFGWPGASSAKARKRHHGAGFAFGQYKNRMAYVAIALELKVDPDTGNVAILRVVAAADCGQIVNPDGVRNQLEGAIVQSASWTLYEQLRFAPEGIQSADWTGYPILRFPAMPKSVEVHLIDQPGAEFLGVAEAAQGPMAGALANALHAATGKAQRTLPLAGKPLRS